MNIQENLNPQNTHPKTCHTVGEWCDSFSSQLLLNVSKTRSLSEVFENSKRINGYDSAMEAWQEAYRKYLHNHFFKGIVDLDAPFDNQADEFFLSSLGVVSNHSNLLKNQSITVSKAARRGDINFFERFAKGLRRAKRHTRRHPFEWTLLMHWIPCCLWLASDSVGATYLQVVTGETIPEENYTKARQRLSLASYRQVGGNKPLITGVTKAGNLRFLRGWTDLDPTSSR